MDESAITLDFFIILSFWLKTTKEILLDDLKDHLVNLDENDLWGYSTFQSEKEVRLEHKLYDYFFHEARFPLVEKHLSPENAKKFKKLSNEDKALFINILIKDGVLSW